MPDTENTEIQSRAVPVGAAAMFPDVLCAIDGKEGGFNAVEHSAALAAPQGRLTFLAVTSYRSGGAHRPPAIGPLAAAGILERAEGIARDAGLPWESEVDPGSPPARVILDWSARYDLLALGAPASSWPSRMLSVGVGNKALEAFTTSLLVARPLEGDERFGDRIVVASDATESSHGLVDFTARLAKTLGSHVTLVHALGRESPIKRGRPREQERTLQEQEQRLERTQPSGTSEAILEQGRTADVIKSAAAAAHASLVVMGSRSADSMRAMGRVSRRVAHQARCSVLLVPPDATAR
ncbi:MAG TPA: universal stress protein [Solirubrobacteraceae bacterium]|jgi:nucleotide-binding universal stress UspA family protein|nr:universal stress protein [Solirubrobacteraceae bacterium]